jgi:anti-sigma-K factor RskA
VAEPIDEPGSDDVLAGELALGVLRDEERAAGLRRMVAEPTLARSVAVWQERLAPLLLDIPAAVAPEDAWRRLDQALAPMAPVAAVRRWRIASAVATAVAACLALLLVTRPVPVTPPPPPPPAPERLLAQVPGAAGAPIVSAQFDAATGALRVRTSNLPTGARAPELWVIVGDAAPRSLGIVTLNGASDYRPEPALRRALIDGAIIAVTLEPRDAPRHDAPSGEIMGTARLTIV